MREWDEVAFPAASGNYNGHETNQSRYTCEFTHTQHFTLVSSHIQHLRALLVITGHRSSIPGAMGTVTPGGLPLSAHTLEVNIHTDAYPHT